MYFIGKDMKLKDFSLLETLACDSRIIKSEETVHLYENKIEMTVENSANNPGRPRSNFIVLSLEPLDTYSPFDNDSVIMEIRNDKVYSSIDGIIYEVLETLSKKSDSDYMFIDNTVPVEYSVNLIAAHIDRSDIFDYSLHVGPSEHTMTLILKNEQGEFSRIDLLSKHKDAVQALIQHKLNY